MSEKLKKFAIGQSIMELFAGPMPPQTFRFTKSESGYKPEAFVGSPMCYRCDAFLIWGACRRIHGSVNRNGVCDLHKDLK